MGLPKILVKKNVHHFFLSFHFEKCENIYSTPLYKHMYLCYCSELIRKKSGREWRCMNSMYRQTICKQRFFLSLFYSTSLFKRIGCACVCNHWQTEKTTRSRKRNVYIYISIRITLEKKSQTKATVKANLTISSAKPNMRRWNYFLFLRDFRFEKCNKPKSNQRLPTAIRPAVVKSIISVNNFFGIHENVICRKSGDLFPLGENNARQNSKTHTQKLRIGSINQ